MRLALALSLGVVSGSFLRVAECAIGEREKRKPTGRLLGPAVDVRMTLTSEAAIGRLHLDAVRGGFDT